jgi:hypothetical protein
MIDGFLELAAGAYAARHRANVGCGDIVGGTDRQECVRWTRGVRWARGFSRLMTFWAVALATTGLIVSAPLDAGAQSIVAPSATAAPSAAPSITGPTFGVNDPCNSVSAIVGRPVQTSGVCTVRPNNVLIETGYQNRSADATSTTVQYPQTTVRIGTAVPALEVDIGLPLYERLNVAGNMTAGTTDIGEGLRYVLGYSARFNYGANVFFTQPSGTNGLSAGASTQTYNFNYGYAINSVLSLAGTVGVDSLPDGSQRYTSLTPSLMLTAGLPSATGLFVEAAQFTNGGGAGTPIRTQFMTGITRGLGSRLQADVEVGRSVSPTTRGDRFVGFGLSCYE